MLETTTLSITLKYLIHSPKFNSKSLWKKMVRWLEDDPFLLGWYIWRRYVKLRGCRDSFQSIPYKLMNKTQPPTRVVSSSSTSISHVSDPEINIWNLFCLRVYGNAQRPKGSKGLPMAICEPTSIIQNAASCVMAPRKQNSSRSN